ncbi:ABC transporter substrate-binding protein [Bhargavaea ullalensis]|uniref:Multiple sugar transport system substrate-binding protein n=1 Tax=Bhargavaea ullalensis TaxID=1265685 RepID=A0ABV2G7I6_9BACL
MRHLKWLSVLFIAVLVLSGCNGFTKGDSAKKDKQAEGEDGKVVLDFWTFWGSEIRRPVVEKIVEDFNKSQDKIEVKHTFVPWGDIWTKELASIAAGSPPDVVINDINATALRGEKKQAENLSKYLEKDDISGNFYEELWNATLYEGDSYGIPFNTDTRVLFYNKDAFKEAGLDPEQPPKTWDELWEFAEKLDVKNGDKYDRMGFYPLFGAGTDVWMLNADKVNFIDENDEVKINTPEKLDTLKWLKSWHDKYGDNNINSWQSQMESQQGNPFFSGDLGMLVQQPTFFTQIRDYAPDLNFGVALLPEKEPGNGNTSWGGGFVAEIPYGAKHPDESWEFIKYLTDKEAQEYWAVKNFDNVANKEAAETAAESDEFSEDGKMVYGLAVEAMPHTMLTPTPVVAPDFPTLINPEFDNVYLGKKTPEQALEDAEKKVQKLIDQNK